MNFLTFITNTYFFFKKIKLTVSSDNCWSAAGMNFVKAIFLRRRRCNFYFYYGRDASGDFSHLTRCSGFFFHVHRIPVYRIGPAATGSVFYELRSPVRSRRRGIAAHAGFLRRLYRAAFLFASLLFGLDEWGFLWRKRIFRLLYYDVRVETFR